ncbi:MAG: PaaI family thioesterase [Candidatus Eremiobacteraeota bacterium]|nr:PaaI family thioesterase [Candidatus Eremiobacteraeota bacterium]MBV9409908.1 PaaI family thioesterase [Candidatus Eremiobacteraeota bacterium]
MTDAEPVDDGRCFACGPYNAEGMHLRFVPDGEGCVRARITLPPRFQGWRGTAHGGIVMTLLDEAMAHACGAIGERGQTAAMQLRFRAPVPLGVALDVIGTVKWKRRHVIALDARVTLADGTLLASAEGSFVSKGTLATKERLGAPDLRFA